MSEKASFYAGAASGFTVRCITQPFDVLKIRFQLQVEPISLESNRSYYRSLFHAIRRIYTEEHIFGFWKGHVPAQLLSIAYSSLQFYSFSNLSQLNGNSTNSHMADFMNGGFSGIFASLIVHPIDVIRTRLVSQGVYKIYSGMLDATLTIGTEEGVKGYFRGLTPSLALIFPQTAIQFTVYHGLVRYGTQQIHRYYGTTQLNPDPTKPHPLLSLTAGAMAGMVSKTAIYPLDLTKRRLQIQSRSFISISRSHFGFPHISSGIYESLSSTVRTEGVSGLFKGWIPSTVKSSIVSSLMFFCYDYVFKPSFSQVFPC